mmetsp:Transcript_65952/g.130803  ORF Transcript_65952/g.130803 Transcript_65952/m.130803 type:complete len:281 (-) Transcript_65952:642-1484(-)
MGFSIGGLTPTSAIDRLQANDPSFTECKLDKNATMQMKGLEFLPKLAKALESNTVCTHLSLTDCNISDQMCASLASALEVNTGLVSLNLQENKVGNEGASQIANSLAKNRSLLEINLLNQKGSRFGDGTLVAFTDMFDTNVTLLKIIWRLESRQSFRLTKMLTRNNDIDRRIKAGKDYSDLLPEKAKPLTDALIAQRAGASIATPRLIESARSTDGMGSEKSSLMPTAPPPPALSSPDPELEAKLTALDAEYEQAVAALKAQFAERKAAIIAEHHTDAAE